MCKKRGPDSGANLVPVVTLVILVTSMTVQYIWQKHPLHRPNDASAYIERHKRVHVTLLTLALICYLRTHISSPGTVDDWSVHRPDLLHPPASPDDSTVISATNTRFCTTCKRTKPPRVHHCSRCDTCILRFDHHCTWTGNCIGLLNAKFFLLFLFYTSALCVHASFQTVVVLRATHQQPRALRGGDPGALVAVAILAPLALLLTTVTGGVLVYLLQANVRLAMRNETALERFRRVGDDDIAADLAMDADDPGSIANLRHLLGCNAALWLIPVHQARRRGRHVAPEGGAFKLTAV